MEKSQPLSSISSPSQPPYIPTQDTLEARLATLESLAQRFTLALYQGAEGGGSANIVARAKVLDAIDAIRTHEELDSAVEGARLNAVLQRGLRVLREHAHRFRTPRGGSSS